MKILIVDDEKNIRDSLAQLLEIEGYSADKADHAISARELLSSVTYSCVLLDLRMPDIDGLELLAWIVERGITAPVMMMSAHGEISDAVKALQIGARDYMVKPFDFEELLLRIQRVIEFHVLENQIRAGKFAYLEKFPSDREIDLSRELSPKMLEIRTMVRKAAPTESTVLITGESGTGKEVIARSIHTMSSRAEGPFVPVNIAGIPESLLESELFGYEKGAFTGAETRRPGIFEAAEGGTVFLDEIGEMPPMLQAKLLRVLQERKIRRIGSTHELAVDIRILAATNRDLEAMVQQSEFREDLFYRLNVVRISLPPLRERSREIPGLIGSLLVKICGKLGRPIPEIEQGAIDRLMAYDYPGNIRELENLLERALILSEGGNIGPADFPGLPHPSKPVSYASSTKPHRYVSPEDGRTGTPVRHNENGVFEGSLKDVERRAIAYALEKNRGNRSHSASDLGISRKTLIAKIREYGLENIGG